jgi:hypothetical protein
MEGRALKPSWADPPRTSPCPLRFVYLGFVAFLWQIPPIRPVLPVYNCFAVAEYAHCPFSVRESPKRVMNSLAVSE